MWKNGVARLLRLHGLQRCDNIVGLLLVKQPEVPLSSRYLANARTVCEVLTDSSLDA